MGKDTQGLVENYKQDTESVYYTWIVNNDERLKHASVNRNRYLLEPRIHFISDIRKHCDAICMFGDSKVFYKN